jgi:hypothetical protein
MKTEKKGKKGGKGNNIPNRKMDGKGNNTPKQKKVENGKNKANRGVKEKETKDQGSDTYEYYS